jgi:hypothetical protein
MSLSDIYLQRLVERPSRVAIVVLIVRVLLHVIVPLLGSHRPLASKT